MTPETARAAAAPAHPWRRVTRSLVAFVFAVAPILPSMVDALGVSRALPLVAALLAIAGGVTRVLALPHVEVLLRRHAPWLAAQDVAAQDVVAQVVNVPVPGVVGMVATTVVAGEAHPTATGEPIDVPLLDH